MLQARQVDSRPLLSHPAIPSASRATRAWARHAMPCHGPPRQDDASPEGSRSTAGEWGRGVPRGSAYIFLLLRSRAGHSRRGRVVALGVPCVDRGGVFLFFFYSSAARLRVMSAFYMRACTLHACSALGGEEVDNRRSAGQKQADRQRQHPLSRAAETLGPVPESRTLCSSL